MKAIATLLVIAAIVILLAVLSSCASDGGFATGDKDVDRIATLKATCNSIETADIAFQAFVHANPTKVDANGISVERSLMQTIKAVCTPPYPTDTEGAMKVAVTALVQIGTVIANWQK